ncbi:BT4734/BF3469 family protein [Edaphocola aurantiacus]|uniref:BT4734/BF3469 family protein n=1 Tax=Edaphocola aurantiacus TaxID=2601682 RepID=UPI001C93F4C0|nr:BT4734/BF3469 family protein [Edaphocola aurantiacus]
MIQNTEISIFSNARSKVPAGVISFNEALQRITDGTYENEITELRNITDKKQRSEFKKALPAVTWSGTFAKRSADALTDYTGFICIDIDDLDNVESVKLQLTEDDIFLAACFVSPSGNGLKLVFYTQADYSKHLEVFEALKGYLFSKYSLVIDESGKDVCRLCFLSYDPEAYVNNSPYAIDQQFIATYTPRKADKPAPAKPKPANTAKSGTDYWDKIHEIVTKTVQPMDGTYNAYINQFAIQANRYGLGIQQCADGVAHFCGWPEPDKEDLATIKSVYSKFSNESSKYLDLVSSDLRGTGLKLKQEDPEAVPPMYDETVLFWYQVPKRDKATGEVLKDPKTDEPLGEYKYSYDDAITFLQNNGFYKYKAGEGYQFIHVDHNRNVIELVNELKIKEFMIEYLKSQPSNEFKSVREMFRRGAKNYCSTGILEGLEYYTPDFKRDTAKAAYIYFSNKYAEITSDGIKMIDYTDRQGAIWRKQQIETEYKDIDYQESDVNRYMWLVATGRKAEIAERSPEEWAKYNSMCTTMGYLLHRYKSPVLTKAVIAVDKSLRSGNDNNGRSGKSLFIKLADRMLKVTTLDGRNFKFDGNRPFSKVTLDTGIINFDDVRSNFDFTRLYSLLTEDFSIEKMYVDTITIPYQDSPKMYLSSNSSIKGEGQSMLARQQIVEFGTYFNASHTPAIEFGRMFFHDWDADEWARYYCFMLNCLHMHLRDGLLAFPLDNYGMNKLIDTASEEFVEYMDETVKDQMKYGHKEYDAGKLYEKYLDHAKPKYPPKKNTWSKFVKMWAELNDLEINAHKQDGRDRRSGVDYYTFTVKGQPIAAPDSGDTNFKPLDL